MFSSCTGLKKHVYAHRREASQLCNMSQDVCSEIQPENTSQSPQEHLAKWLWELLETQFATDMVHLSVRTSFDA